MGRLMKTKDDIVANWLPRYTDTPLDGFGKYTRLTACPVLVSLEFGQDVRT